MPTFSDLFSSIVSIVSYVLTGIAILNFCGDLKINKGWRGFVPLLNIYTLGKIAEACCERIHEKKKYAVRMLVFRLISLAFLIPIYIILIDMGAFNGTLAPNREVSSDLISNLFIILGLLLAVLAFLILYVVYLFIAVHKIFECYVPESATLCTVLFVILDVLSFSFILLYVISNRDLPDYEEPSDNNDLSDTQYPPISPEV